MDPWTSQQPGVQLMISYRHHDSHCGPGPQVASLSDFPENLMLAPGLGGGLISFRFSNFPDIDYSPYESATLRQK